jgi:RNA polymerase sigma-70 factor (ECF subfamily)
MPQTPHTLLARLRNRRDNQAWQLWLTIYEPWLRYQLTQRRLQQADIDDLLQNVLGVVSQKLPAFVHNGQPGAFRAWLRAILVNEVRNFFRGRQRLASEPSIDWLDHLEDPASELSRQWDAEHDQQIARRLLATIEPDFERPTWEAFRLLVLEDRPAAEVAQRTGVTLNSLYIAKSRVLKRLRRELDGLVGT